jgi:hypothetical protein
MEPRAGDQSVDRRWYPTGDRDEWALTTRTATFEAVRRCVTHALYSSLADVHPHELQVSDAVFRELHICTQAYAKALFAIGQGSEGAAALIVAAAREASLPDELHPCVVAALEEWCHEANARPL